MPATSLLALALLMSVAPLTAQDTDEQETSASQRARITLRLDLGGTGYNRIEGLPFLVGPVARSGGVTPFRGEVLALIRSDPTIGLDQVGYRVRGEKIFGSTHRIVAGVGLHSLVRAIEPRGLSNIENSLNAAVFHQDHRDYYNTQGFSAYAAYQPRRSPFFAGFELRTERHEALSPGRAGAILSNTIGWRPQPLVAEGWLQTASIGARYDTRSQRAVLRAGSLLEVELIRGLGGSLAYPPARDAVTALDVALPAIDPTFTLASLDLRRHQSIGNARLSVRFNAAGALSDGRLPPQAQYAPGGAGSVPGIDGLPNDSSNFAATSRLGVNKRALDCGARDNGITAADGRIGSEFYPSYGCDKYALLQIQLEGYFGFRIGGRELDMRDPRVNLNFELIPRWVVFFDAAQAWSNGDLGSYLRPDEALVYDIGGGVAFGDLGVFLAIPLQDGGGRGPNFRVRLGSRI